MNHEWEEKKLKALFHELRQEDEFGAPSFASIWDAAIASRRRSGQPRPTVRLVGVTAGVLVLLAGSHFVFFRQPSSQPVQTTAKSEAPSGITPSEKPVAVSQNPASQSPVSRRARTQLVKPPLEATPGRERPRVLQRRISAKPLYTELISQWRSPTGFLLESPGDQLLKTVPLLGETSLDIKAMTP